MATISTPVHLFHNDDPGYLAWLAAHRNGFVVNCHAQPLATYLMLHRASCTWINPPRYKNWTTVGYIKVCASSIADLGAWALGATGGALQPCKTCRPQRPSGQPVASRQPTTAPEPGGIEVTSPGAVVTGSARIPSDPPPAGALVVPSGLQITTPLERLLAFCREEYAYYDGIADHDPDHVLPVDVLATISMNSFIDKAALVRKVHRGLAGRCDPILPEIPAHADLLTFDPDLAVFRRLIHEAVQAPEVLVPRAVKVLHRKRRSYVPMLDSVVLEYYLRVSGKSDRKELLQDRRHAADVAVHALCSFRDDLRAITGELDELLNTLAAEGFPLTRVRALEVLVWTETEPRGYYRGARS
jgi:Family of unknown function (DUF6308)